MIDLHTHSTVSDGSESPGRICELAAEAGCSAVALTDHDSLAGLPDAQASATRLGVELVPGCEVSCAYSSGSMHVLVYFVEDPGSPLGEELARLRQDRLTRNRRLADRLADLGLPITYEALVERAGGEAGLGRPHVAALLVDIGAADSIQDAFDRWLGAGRPAYVPKARITAPEVARLARDSSAVAVLAHPLSLGLAPGELAATVRELAGAGFGGIEAIYGRYSPEERGMLEDLAAESSLVATGGSDFHGSFKPDLSVGTGRGDLEVPDSVVEDLAARRRTTARRRTAAGLAPGMTQPETMPMGRLAGD